MSYTISQPVTITPKKKIGRNDPCYCGSGKKYKKCCLYKDSKPADAGFEAGTISQVISWLLGKSWFSDRLKDELDKLGQVKEAEEETVSALIEALMYEMSHQGKTPLEIYTEEANLSDDQRQYYRHWVKEAFFSVFRVEHVNLGASLELTEMTSGRKYLVSEKSATYQAEEGQILFTRIAPHKDTWVITGGQMNVYPREAGYEISRLAGTRKQKYLTQLEAIELFFRKSNQENLPGTYEDLIKLLEKEMKKRRINIDIKNKFEELLDGSAGTDINQLLSSVSSLCADADDVNYMTDLMLRAYRAHPKSAGAKSGPQEEKLLQQMFRESSLEKFDKLPQERVQPAYDKFVVRWINTPQKELKGRTPKQIIDEERRLKGLPAAGFKYSLSITPIGSSPDTESENEYMKAVRLMQDKKSYLRALKLFAETFDAQGLSDQGFRWFNNVGLCLLSLGQTDLARKYFERSLKLNPYYDIARKNLSNWANVSRVAVMESQGRNTLLRELWEGLEFGKLDFSQNEFIKDARTFFNYINTHGVKIGLVRRFITFKTVLEINNLFSHPDPLYPFEFKDAIFREEWQMPKVNFLHVAASSGQLINQKFRTIRLTNSGLGLLTLNDPEFFRMWLGIYCFETPWERLRTDFRGSARDDINRLMAILNLYFFDIWTVINKSGEGINPSDIVTKIKPGTGRLSTDDKFIYGLLLEKILGILKWMGLVNHNGNRNFKLMMPDSDKNLWSMTMEGKQIYENILNLIKVAVPQKIAAYFD